MNELKTRKSWKVANRKLEGATSFIQWLSILHEVLNTPKYSMLVPTAFDPKTGKPVKGLWKVQHNSKELVFSLSKDEVASQPEAIQPRLLELFSFFDKTKEPIVYTTSPSEERSFKALVVSKEWTQTGGGHNEGPSYGSKLRFSSVYSMYPVLSASVVKAKAKKLECKHDWSIVRDHISDLPTGERCSKCGTQKFF